MHLRVLVNFKATVMGIERRMDFRKQFKSEPTKTDDRKVQSTHEIVHVRYARVLCYCK